MTLILSGTSGLSDVDGSAATPAIRGTDANTGIFFPAADTIAFSEGGTEAMRIDSSGNVGIGATSPKKRLTVSDASSASTTPGTNPVIWVGGGNVLVNTLSEIGFIYGSNSWSESNVPATVGFQLTSTAGFGKGALTFCTRDVTTDTAPTERMRIDSSGNLLVGTTSTSPGYVNTNTGVAINPNGYNCFSRSGADYSIVVNNNTGSTYYLIAFRAAGASTGSITSNGTTTSYTTTSDYRLKDNIAPMTGALGKVAALKPVTYTWKSNGAESQGFIAHELAEVVPDCVVGEKDAVETYTDEDGVEQTRIKPQGIDTSFLVATLTAAIQEQQAIITQLQADVAALKAQP